MLWLRRRRGTVNAWSPDAKTPQSGSTYGTLDGYFSKIAELDEGGFDGFFVTASAIGSDHIIQMSAGTDQNGVAFYEFDVPLTGWSNSYAEAVEAEGRKRGAQPVRTEGDIGFLDVGFAAIGEHDDFAKWVASDVFRLPETTQYEITWG